MIIESALFKLTSCFLGICAAWGFSRVLDLFNGRNFKRDILTKINGDPGANATYYGLRFVGILIFMGIVWG